MSKVDSSKQRKMKLSKYTVKVDEYPDAGSNLLFNTLTRGLLVVDDTLLDYLCRGEFGEITSEVLYALERNGIVVGEEVDEVMLFNYWLNKNKYNPLCLSLAILTTYSCNCKCAYCYEAGLEEGQSLTTHVCEEIMAWIDTMVNSYSPLELDICFHGGEPLLNMPAIEYISQTCLQIARKKSLKHSLSIVTNGTLLSPQTVLKLTQLGIHRAMVTIDGPPEIHDARRPFKNGRGTFTTVFNNLLYAIGKIELVIGINFDKHNYESIPELFQLLKRSIKAPMGKEFNIAVGQVAPGLSPTPHCDTYTCEPFLGGKWMAELYRAAIREGIKTDNPIGFGLCTLNKESSFVIDPYGAIYKCITGVGRKEFKIGSIRDEPFKLARSLSRFTELKPWENKRCWECKYLPLCIGGCREQALVKYGDMSKLYCMKEFIESWLPGALKASYELQILLNSFHKGK